MHRCRGDQPSSVIGVVPSSRRRVDPGRSHACVKFWRAREGAVPPNPSLPHLISPVKQALRCSFLPQSRAPTFGGCDVECLSKEEHASICKQEEQGCPGYCVSGNGGGGGLQPQSGWRLVVGRGCRGPNPRSRKRNNSDGAEVPHLPFPQQQHNDASYLHWYIWWRCLPRRCDGSIVFEQWVSILHFTI